MTITAKVIADSIGPKTRRLTTLELRYPRFIHAEFMTHRDFSRNASSSRAIPVERQIAAIKEDTAMPIHWGKNQAGMQAHEECNEPIALPLYKLPDRVELSVVDGVPKIPQVSLGDHVLMSKYSAWMEARDRAIEVAEGFVAAGYHKQVVNRLLEPFSHITVVMTATRFDNFFGLRRHPDAQPEIKALADAMFDAMEGSTPTLLTPGGWHLPYVTDEDRAQFQTDHDNCLICNSPLIKISVARCARTSYKTHDGKKPTAEADMALYDKLIVMDPAHASPAEHQATPDELRWNSAELKEWANPHLHGNLQGGWRQFRKFVPNENIDTWEDTLNVFE